MNKQPHPERSLLHFMLRAQQIAQQEGESDKGYAMVVVSILTIIMLSLLAAATTFTNLAKSRTDAFVDGNSIFYVAESGLNRRAVEFRNRLETYSGVAEVSAATSLQTLSDCLSAGISSATPGADALGCRNYSFNSSNNISRAVEGGNIALSSGDAVQNNYVAYTLVTRNAPRTIAIPANEDYEGLNALEYTYVLRSTAKKPVASETTPLGNANKSSANVDLSMTFTNRVISLFQFAIFYNGDLEFNSTSPMQVQGRVHSNANIYVQPAGETSFARDSITTFLSRVSAGGSIYNRVDAWTPGIGRTGITRLLLTGTSCPDDSVFPLPAGSNCRDISNYSAANTNPLTSTEIDLFQRQLQAGISRLKTPPSSFTRKRSYETNKIGEYFAKADMRLEFVPNRGGFSQAVIPFDFTAMTTTGAGTCSTAAPIAGSDPAANYVAPDREGLSALKCNRLTKGQLQSLRQPVMVRTDLNQTTALAGQESTTLGRPTLPTVPTVPGLSGSSINTPANQDKVLRALQVALVSTPAPISIDRLNTAFNSPIVLTPSDLNYDPTLNAFRAEFSRLLDDLFPAPISGVLTPDQLLNRNYKAALLTISPNQIAALRGAWFLPAPIQRVITTNAATPTNPLRLGFYDGRERKWISVLQTNIASLAVWNRDGLFVDADNPDMTTAYASTQTARNAAASAGYSTDGLAFKRATPADIAAAVPAITAKGLQPLGLGSIDSTEGGLVVHATVNDDLNGNGSIDPATEITRDTIRPITETRTNPDGTTTTVTIDYYRQYGGSTSNPTPSAFAFTGGDFLPNNLLLSSDRAIYVQGNFNNNNNTDLPTSTTPNPTPRPIPENTANTPSTARLSASIVADTITVLSNDCISSTPSTLGVPAGQLNCGIGEVGGGANLVTRPMVINAAFLSNTDVSVGNLGTGRGYVAGNTTNNKYSGGVNNYIRLLEDWNNGGNPYALNYMGSMVSLGAPLEYNGRFRPGGDAATGAGPTFVPASYYNIPFRSFSYDPYFSEIDKMPPLTPKASYVQQKNFTRVY